MADKVPNFNEWLSCNGHDRETIDGQQLTELQAQWRAAVGRENPELARIRAGRFHGELIPAGSGGGGGNRVGSMVEAALLVRAGYSHLVPEGARPQANHLAKKKFGDLLRGDNDDGPTPYASISTASVANIVSTVANKIAMQSWSEAPATWRSFCSIKSTPDLKLNTALRPAWYSGLARVAPGGDVTHGNIDTELYTWQAYTFSKLYGLARETVINDDAGVFGDIVPGLVRSAATTLSDLVWAIIMSNAGSFFAAGNSNTQTGGGSVLAAAGLAVAIKNLRLQRTPAGAAINIIPRVLVVPPTLEQTALALLKSQELVGSTTANSLLPSGNPFSTLNLILEVEPRLEQGVTHPITGATVAGSTTRWYLFSGPIDVPVAVGFLDGRQAPIVDTFDLNTEPNKLEYGFRVVHDFGASLVDYRAAQHSAGA